MDRSQERGVIAHNVQNVLKLFRNVATSFQQDTESPDDQCESYSLRKLLPTFENEITRFKMWTGNLAAHQSGQASLDHRLREAPHVQEQVVYLLLDISESLEDTMALVMHGKSPMNIENKQDEPAFPQENLGQGSEDDFTDSDLEDDENLSPETRLSSLLTDICEAIDCLLRLSVAIANPAPHERFRKLGAGPSEDVSFYEAHDIRYVRDKFPKANKGLSDVLGKFITRRRQFFKYREAHHAKLAAGLDQEAQKDTSRTEIIPKTVASSLPEHFKGTTVIDEDNRSDTAISETSYATSAGFLMQEDGRMKPAPPLKVPPPPPEAEKGAFECPFCYRMVSARTRRTWKRHVFGDLRPYTCLFSRCAESNTDFDRRHRWQLHVTQYHWRAWSCPFKCRGMFPSSMELEDHIRHQHLPDANNEHLKAVVARGEVPVPYDFAKECPLCGHIVSSSNSYIKHVGRHMEQLALFALPDMRDEVPEDGAESDEQNDVGSDIHVGSVGSGISGFSSHQSDEQLNGAGDQVEQEVQSREREESKYSIRAAEDNSERGVGERSEHEHDPPHREANDPSTERDDSPDQPLEGPQTLQQDTRNVTNEVIKEQKFILGTDESSKEARGPNTGASPTPQNRLLSSALGFGTIAAQLDELQSFQYAKEDYLKACDLLDQALQMTWSSENKGTIQSIRQRYMTRIAKIEEMLPKQNASVESKAASGAEQPARPVFRRSNSEAISGNPSPSPRLEKVSMGEPGEGSRAPMERIMTGQQGPINSIDPHDAPEPVVQGAQPVFTRMSRKHLSIETLRTFSVDFDLDPDPEYVLIKRWVPEWEQDQMWKHTKLTREARGERFLSGEWKAQDDNPEIPSGEISSRFEEGMATPTTENGAAPPPSPQIIRGPKIEREIITHYRDIDHGMPKASSSKGYTCGNCDKTFSRADHLRRHELSHIEPGFPCDFPDCDKAFYRKDLLDRHIQRHEAERKIREQK